MTLKTELNRPLEAIIPGTHGSYSRDVVPLVTGTARQSGQVMGVVTSSGEWTNWAPGASDGSEVIAGVLAIGTSANATNGVAVVRQARLDMGHVVHSGTDADVVAGLAAIGILPMPRVSGGQVTFRLRGGAGIDDLANQVIGVNEFDGDDLALQGTKGFLVLHINGTGATLEAPFGDGESDPFTLIIDGVAQPAPTRTGGVLTLYSGLPDAERVVVVGFTQPAGLNGYFSNDGELALTVSGKYPFSLNYAGGITIGDTSFATASSSRENTASGPITGDALPDRIKYNSGDFPNSIVSASWEMDGEEFVYWCDKQGDIVLQINGGDLIRIANESASGTYMRYNVGRGKKNITLHHDTSDNQFDIIAGVLVNGEFTTKYRPKLHVYGHSIVAGDTYGTPLTTDMMLTSARNGMVYDNYGVGGRTIAGLASRTAGFAQYTTVDSRDIAIVDLGQNDGPEAMTAQEITDYNTILNGLVSIGYGRIICLGALNNSQDFTPFNASLASLVVSRNDSIDVLYLDRSAYTNINRPDTVHPDDAGYIQVDNYNKKYLDPLIQAHING